MRSEIVPYGAEDSEKIVSLPRRVYENADEFLILVDLPSRRRGESGGLDAAHIMTPELLNALFNDGTAEHNPERANLKNAAVELHAAVLLVRIPKHQVAAAKRLEDTTESIGHNEILHFG